MPSKKKREKKRKGGRKKKAPVLCMLFRLSHFQAVCMQGSWGFYPHREPAWNLSLSIFTHSPIQTSLFSHQPHNEGFVLVLFVHLWHLFFLTAPSPSDSMQRMQIRAPLFIGPLPWMNATLNEDTHTCKRAAWKRARITLSFSSFFSTWCCLWIADINRKDTV